MQSTSSSPGGGTGTGSAATDTDAARPSEAAASASSVRFHFRDVVSTLLPASNPLHEPLALHARPTDDEIKQDAEKQETSSLIELQSPKVMIREGHGHGHGHGKEGFSPLETHSSNDPYAFKINKSHRQPTFESVSKHPWNVPLKRLDTHIVPSTHSTWLPYSLHWPLFAFPYNINTVNARIVGILVTGICAVIIAERKQRWAYYLTLLMCADFALRFLFGGRGSFLGAVAEIPAYFFPRKWTPGPPKQFAALCGVMFSGAATLLFFLSADDDNIAASVIIGILMGCAALEGFLDFCVGCLFFKIGQKFNIFPMNNRSELVYDETDRTSLEMEYEIDRRSVRPLNILVPDGERKLPLSYKSSTDAQKRANFHPIKHMNGAHYLIPMGLAGLAIVWLEMTQGPYPTIPKVVWHILAVVSGCVWGALFVLHIFKAVLFPHKIKAEWEHPQQRHFLCALPITILLFAYLAQKGDETILAEVLFWIGGPLQLTLTVLIISSWIRHLHHHDNFTPAWMMAPLGNLVAALVLPLIRGGKFTEVAYLWLSIAIFMWIIMTTMSLTRLTFRAPLDDGIRSSVFMLLAAPSVIMIAWLSINGLVLDAFARFAFYIAVVFSFVLTFLTLFGYFGRNKFDISYWGYAFPLDTIAIAAIYYHSYMGKELTDAMATTYLVLTTFIHAILAAHTVHGLTSRNNGIFLSEERSGPLVWLRIFHYASKYSLEKLNKLAGQFTHDDKVEEFCREFVNFRVALETHMRHEEEIFFPAFRSLWPGITIDADEEHDRDEELVARMHSLVDQVMSNLGGAGAGAGRASLLAEIEKLMPVLSQTTLDHIEHEEAHLQFMAIKYIPLSWQYRLARSMWESTSAQDWSVVIPFLLNHQWVHGRRVKLLQSLRWALPEHIQQIGHWVYEGVDEFLFDRLLVDIPELAPRHVRGHYRIW